MNIQFLENGAFILTLDDERKVKGRFCMWQLRRFSEMIEIGNVIELLNNFSTGMTVNQYAQFILSAIQNYFRTDPDKNCEWKVDNVLDWIDDMGGLNGKDFLNLFMHGLGTHTAVKEIKAEEKKSNKEDGSAGENLNENVAKQE